MTCAPRCIILAGPNGAGKSTIARALVLELHGIRRFINVDTIAAGLSAFAPELVDHRAARIALDTMTAAVARREDFAVETTLSGRRWPRVITTLSAAGYDTLLYFLRVPSVDLCVQRVATRVQMGGHHVPVQTIARRYVGGAENFEQMTQQRRSAWHELDASGVNGATWLRTGARFDETSTDGSANPERIGIDRASTGEIESAARGAAARAHRLHLALGVPWVGTGAAEVTPR